jgi:hypothetical protein
MLLPHGSMTAQWFSPHQHHLQQSHLFNILWIKSKLTLFIGLSICPFRKVPRLPEKAIFLLFLERLWPPLIQSRLPPSPTTWEPSDLSGLDPSSFPLVCPCPLLTHPTSPSHFQENHVIWVDLILKVPLGFHSDSPLSLLSFHNDGFCMFYIVHGMYILLYCLINTVIVQIFSLLYFWS